MGCIAYVCLGMPGCRVQAGYGMTDPGPTWHPEGLTRFDPSPRKLMIDHTPYVIPRASYTIGNLVAKAAGACGTLCQVRTGRCPMTAGPINLELLVPRVASLYPARVQQVGCCMMGSLLLAAGNGACDQPAPAGQAAHQHQLWGRRAAQGCDPVLQPADRLVHAPSGAPVPSLSRYLTVAFITSPVVHKGSEI